MNLRQKSSRYSAGVLFFAAVTGAVLVISSIVSGFKTSFEIWLACGLVASLILHARAGFALSRAQQEIDLLRGLVQKFHSETKKVRLSLVKKTDDAEAANEDARSLDRVKEAIENDRIDLYLQPIVSLETRSVRHFEAFSRLRNCDGSILQPTDYLEAAERANQIGLIDNMILLRAVQALREIGKGNRECRIFCNISPATIFDREFFIQFTDYLDANKDLSQQLVFEFTYPATEMMNRTVEQNLAAVAERGYAFSVDHIRRFDLDWAALSAKNFKFVKASSTLLLGDGEAGRFSKERLADLMGRLRESGIELIAEKIEFEGHLPPIRDLGVELGQGALFGAPRPARNYMSAFQSFAKAS